MNVRRLVLLLLSIAWTAVALSAVADGPKPTPFVTVYRDDAVAFQVRHDRITVLEDGVYKVWLRWLYAEPQPWKSSFETSRIVVADIDCRELRVRELAVLHKDRDGKLFDVEEFAEEDWKWRSFEANSGAAATMKRLCEFVPQLKAAE